jgi:hypothetical protein
MATSVYFNSFSPALTNEQRLMEDVIVESIKIMGHDVKYLPREAYDSTDDIIGESPQAKFTRAYTVEMYLANVEGYEGDGDFFSKFGLEIRDTSNFIISRKTFERYIPSKVAKRPREGDLIFVPLLGKVFEIKFVEEELMFFALGKRSPFIYELRCEVFRYSQEDFETGDKQIDDLEHGAAYTIELNVGAGSGNYHINEILYQGSNLSSSTVSAEVKYWDNANNKLQVINIKGVFTNGSNVIGSSSNTRYVLTNYDDLTDLIDWDDSDNRVIQTEANNFIDLTEINPFGAP